MINKKIDEISAKLDTIKLLVQDNEYLSNVEKSCDKVNKRNQILEDKNKKLEQENKKLKKEIKKLEAELELYRDNELYLNNKIDKAIEYISKHNCIATYEEYKPTEYEYCCSSDLLDILKGEDNE